MKVLPLPPGGERNGPRTRHLPPGEPGGRCVAVGLSGPAAWGGRGNVNQDAAVIVRSEELIGICVQEKAKPFEPVATDCTWIRKFTTPSV